MSEDTFIERETPEQSAEAHESPYSPGLAPAAVIPRFSPKELRLGREKVDLALKEADQGPALPDRWTKRPSKKWRERYRRHLGNEN
jgi:hypothetical protein